MARLPTALLRRARAIDALLPALLPPCRDLRTAQNELRWLREHVDDVAKTRSLKAKDALLRRLVQERAKGKPLQYIIGTEFFGDLEIQCRPGVLIPRQETAASITHLANLINLRDERTSELRVLDLCTGTGCIPLLFQHEFLSRHDHVQLRLLGIDVSEQAIELAKHNLKHVQLHDKRSRSWNVEFLRADVLASRFDKQTPGTLGVTAALNNTLKAPTWDILISNPPYISPSGYWTNTTRSVRGFEPKLALVPLPSTEARTDVEQGDSFYPRLLTIAKDVDAKMVLFEVADLEQAVRVARMAKHLNIFDGIEIWRDQPDQERSEEETADKEGEFSTVGSGSGRSVFCWRGTGATWLGKSSI